MVKQFIITDPKHDLITNYLHDFSKEIIKTAKETRGIHVSHLEGSQATRKKLENCLHQNSLVFLNGHGDIASVAGYKDEIILNKNNIILTKDQIIYALSCDSLEGLGPLAVEKGAKAYIGYKARFMLIIDPARQGTPSKDKNALPFKRACFKTINALFNGMNVAKTIELTKEEYRHSIKSYGTSEDNPFGDTPLIRFALAWNLEFLDYEGDPNISF